jgi:hypothetical protein
MLTYKEVALLLLLIASGAPAEAEIKNAGGFGRNPSARWIAVSETRVSGILCKRVLN